MKENPQDNVYSMSLEEKLGHMLMVGFRGYELENGVFPETVLSGGIPAGYILFDKDVARGTDTRNIESPDQLRRLTDAIRKRTDAPVFIATDQEGGRVSRLSPQRGFSPIPSHQELGSLPVEETYHQSRKTASLLKSMGIDMNFAPCVDLGIAKNSAVIYGLGRCFSEEPLVVLRHAKAWLQGHKEEQVHAVLKHFPGHGSASGDTHKGIVDASSTWSEAELEPYKALIRGREADMVMISHLYIRQLDPLYPASLSEKIIGTLLREHLGFEGLVISDDLQMSAITDEFGISESIRRAITAGNDLLVFGNNLCYDPEIVSRFIHTVTGMIEKGEITEERIDASVVRILKAKKGFL
ncbi:glycoside hydrolase family 3 N-terminal domain-containing protein [Balneolaceae bacterium ANBcel3]|nr:glycoside hydrolase family 3 N-terminal domain-containing protein [Balneolaceae bacterium ANBcel3]